MKDFYYNGVWRMDWGLGNPNKTAALIAMLMVAVWAAAFLWRRGFWVALPMFTGLGVCLINTFSRGGLLAAFAGLSAVVWVLPRPWPRQRVVAVTIAVWVMIGSAVYLQAHGRYGQGVMSEDRSISNRLAIWKAAPRMMTDAPQGWGLGNAGQAYMQWYQPLERQERYRTLVNSHLTWLVEFGWPMRFVYVTGWLAVFTVCWPFGYGSRFIPTAGGQGGSRFNGFGSGRTGREALTAAALTEQRPPIASSVERPPLVGGGRALFPIALGVWIAFGVAATFSSVAESPWLWIGPGAAFFAAVGYRLKRVWPWAHGNAGAVRSWQDPPDLPKREGVNPSPTFTTCARWPKLGSWLLAPLMAATLMVGFYVAGGGDSGIRGSPDRVIVGRGEPEIWLVADENTFGGQHGKELRRFFRDGSPGQVGFHPEKAGKSAVGVVSSAVFLGDVRGKTVIWGGYAAARDMDGVRRSLMTANKLVLVQPSFLPVELNISEEHAARIEAVFGEFSQSPVMNAWAAVARVRRVEGAGDFLPRWPEALLVAHP